MHILAVLSEISLSTLRKCLRVKCIKQKKALYIMSSFDLQTDFLMDM